MPTPLPVGLFQWKHENYGKGPGNDTTGPIWKATQYGIQPNTVLDLIANARTYGITVYANLVGSRAQYTDAVGGNLIFNMSKYEARVRRFTVAGGASAAVAAAVALAFTDKVFVAYTIDEPNIDIFAGSVPPSVCNQLGLLHKSIWPGCLTAIRCQSSYLKDGIPGGYTGLDYGWAQYGTPHRSETFAAFQARNKAEFLSVDMGCVPGVNWVNAPTPQQAFGSVAFPSNLWDHDNNPATADKRVWGDNSTNKGLVVGDEPTTNIYWMASPNYLRACADYIKNDLDAPTFMIWANPISESTIREDIYKPYWDRSDFVSAEDYVINTLATRASWTGWRTPKGSTPPPPPPSATIGYAYKEISTRVTTPNTTYTDVVGLKINASELTAGHKYAIFLQGELDMSTADNGYCRLVHGATAFDRSELVWQRIDSNQKRPYGFMTTWTAVGGEALQVQIRVETGQTATAGIDNFTMMALDLDSLPANSYFTNLNSVSTALNGTPADGASITFTPAVNNNTWAIFTCAQYNTPSATQSIISRLNTSGGAAETEPQVQMEGEDAVNDRMLLFTAKTRVLSNVAWTFKEQSSNGGGGGPRVSSEILALNLSNFPAFAAAYSSSTLNYEATAPFVTQAQTCSVTLTADGPVWCFGSVGLVHTAISRKFKHRLTLFEVDLPTSQTEDAYLQINYDSTDVQPLWKQGVRDQAAGVRALDLDGSVDIATAGRGGKQRMTFAVQLGGAVTGGNTAPVWNAIAAITANEGETISFTAVASDAQDAESALTYSVVGSLPAGATFDPTTRIFAWTPSQSQAGTYAVVLRVTDTGGASVDQTVDITVVDVPTPVDFIDLRSLRFDWGIQSQRIKLNVTWNAGSTVVERHGITGVIVEMADMGRI